LLHSTISIPESCLGWNVVTGLCQLKASVPILLRHLQEYPIIIPNSCFLRKNEKKIHLQQLPNSPPNLLVLKNPPCT
jgi:hypothetical protein